MPIDYGRDLDRAAHPEPCKTNPDGTRKYTPMPAPENLKPDGNFGRPFEDQK